MEGIEYILNQKVKLLVNEDTKRLTKKYDLNKVPEEPVPSSLGKYQYEEVAIRLLSVYKELGQVVAVPVKAFSKHISVDDSSVCSYDANEVLTSKLMNVDNSRLDFEDEVYSYPKDEFFDRQKVPIKK